jgi:hypothetical protein
MTTQHTPGPWGCDWTSHHSHDYRLQQPNGAPLRLVVEANDHNEQRANARLIAAAPDLLAALEVVREYMDHAADQFSYEDIVQIRAAIAKATGN